MARSAPMDDTPVELSSSKMLIFFSKNQEREFKFGQGLYEE